MPFNLVRRLYSPDDGQGGGGNGGDGGLMIPKYRFDEVNTKNQALEAQVSELKAKVETLEKEATTKDEKISSLEKELSDTKATYEKEKSDAKRMEAVKASIGDGVQDVDVLLKLIDMDKVTLGEDGKLTGLDDQVKELKTSKPFLFKAPPAPVKPSDKPGAPKEKSFATKLAEKKVAEKKVTKGAKSYFG